MIDYFEDRTHSVSFSYSDFLKLIHALDLSRDRLSVCISHAASAGHAYAVESFVCEYVQLGQLEKLLRSAINVS